MRKTPNRFKYQAEESSDKSGKNPLAKSVKVLCTQVFFREGASNFLGSLIILFKLRQFFRNVSSLELLGLTSARAAAASAPPSRCHSRRHLCATKAAPAAAHALPSEGTSPAPAHGRRGGGARSLCRLRKVLSKARQLAAPVATVSPSFFLSPPTAPA